MTMQQTASSCANCFHDEENHHDGVCSGDLTCMCSKYIEPFLFEFAQRVEEEKYIRKSIYKSHLRCKQTLGQFRIIIKL